MIKNSAVVAIFREFLTRYPRQFGLLFMLLVVEGAAAALTILAVVPLADFLLDPTLNEPSRITRFVINVSLQASVQPNFWLFGFLFVALTALKCLLEVAIRYAILSIKYFVLGRLIDDALSTFFKARWGFFSATDNGRLINTLNKEIPNIGDTLGALTTLLAQAVQLATYLAVPLWLNFPMTSTALGLALLFGAPFMLLHRISYQLGKGNTETGNVYTATLNEVFGAARIVIGFGRQAQARDRTMAGYQGHVRATLRSQTLAAAIQKLYNPLGILAAVIAMGFAIQQQARVPELAAVMWSLLAAVPILSALLQGNISISNFLPSYEQLSSLRKLAVEFEEVEGARCFNKLEHGIELKNVHFTYPERLCTLADLEIVVPKGKMIALVGESGSGKSTVTDLVLGLQIPGRGHVLVDGVPLGEWKQNSFRERIGYVPQDPLLFHTSIRNNMLWSFDQASENDLWEALKLANAASFVKELPQGLDTVVGDRGVRLSGGQRQRIAIARAMLRKPELLILDEATSALDSESEQLIQKSIEQVARETTILLVAHRLSTVAKADYVYVLQQGRVAEEGIYLDLCRKPDGILARMSQVQAPLRSVVNATG